MKRFSSGVIVGLLVLVLLLAFWEGGLSVSLGKEKTITVSGTGKVTMKPEVARFTAGVQKFGSTVFEAMEQEKQVTGNIISSLKEMGIKEEDIKTAYFSVWPQTSDTYEGNVRKTQITGYSVSNSIEVKIRDITQVSNLLSKVIAAGANNVSGVSFSADDPKKQEVEARNKAIEDATEKAQKMAAAAGKKLGKVISISEGSQTNVFPTYKDGMGGGGGPAIETGSLEVIQTVTMVFVLK